MRFIRDTLPKRIFLYQQRRITTIPLFRLDGGKSAFQPRTDFLDLIEGFVEIFTPVIAFDKCVVQNDSFKTLTICRAMDDGAINVEMSTNHGRNRIVKNGKSWLEFSLLLDPFDTS